jgi:hypothetical protein
LDHYDEEIIKFVIISINKIAFERLDGGKRFAKSKLSEIIANDKHKKQETEKVFNKYETQRSNYFCNFWR